MLERVQGVIVAAATQAAFAVWKGVALPDGAASGATELTRPCAIGAVVVISERCRSTVSGDLVETCSFWSIFCNTIESDHRAALDCGGAGASGRAVKD